MLPYQQRPSEVDFLLAEIQDLLQKQAASGLSLHGREKGFTPHFFWFLRTQEIPDPFNFPQGPHADKLVLQTP